MLVPPLALVPEASAISASWECHIQVPAFQLVVYCPRLYSVLSVF